MSIKRQLQSHYKNLINSVQSIELPGWFVSLPVRIGLMAVVLILGVAYIARVTNAATTGYQINNLEKQINSLSQDIQKLEIKVAENCALSNIQNRLAATNMIAVSKVNYLSAIPTVMARR